MTYGFGRLVRPRLVSSRFRGFPGGIKNLCAFSLTDLDFLLDSEDSQAASKIFVLLVVGSSRITRVVDNKYIIFDFPAPFYVRVLTNQ
jgi:hypothetical protein